MQGEHRMQGRRIDPWQFSIDRALFEYAFLSFLFGSPCTAGTAVEDYYEPGTWSIMPNTILVSLLKMIEVWAPQETT